MVREGRSLGEVEFEKAGVGEGLGKGSSKMLFVCGPGISRIDGGRGGREWEPGVGTTAAWGSRRGGGEGAEGRRAS